MELAVDFFLNQKLAANMRISTLPHHIIGRSNPLFLTDPAFFPFLASQNLEIFSLNLEDSLELVNAEVNMRFSEI